MSTRHDGIGIGWFAAILGAAALFYGVHTGTPGQYRTDEVQYVGSALTALETGDWVVLLSNGVPRLQKPPLQSWMVASSYAVFGVGLWQARLPSVVLGVGAVALTAWLALLLFDSRRVALYAAGIVLGSSFLLRQAHWAITDSALTFFLLGAACGFMLAQRGRPRGAWLAWFFMGCAFLQKGPVGLILPLLVFAAWLRVEGRDRPVSWRPLYDPLGLLLFAAMVLPWPLLAIARLGSDGFFGPVGAELGFHLTWSLTGALELLARYPTDLARALLPWAPLLFFGLRPEGRTRGTRFVWYWVFAFWLVFSLFVLKHRWRYMVPAVPAVAILAGHGLDALQRRLESDPRPALELWVVQWALPIWFAAHAAWGAILIYTSSQMLGVPEATRVAVWVLVLALLFLGGTLWLQRRAAAHLWVVTAALGIGVIETTGTISFKAQLPTSPAWELAHAHLRGRGESFASMGLGSLRRVWAWSGAGRTFPFYDVPEASDAEAWQGVGTFDLLLLSDAALAAMPEELRGRYREVDRVLGVDKDPDLVWWPSQVEPTREEWLEDAFGVVLLERLPTPRAQRPDDARSATVPARP